jgi:phenylacetate-coenzyme A ligase PaaK-like adenylate-forming protein
MTTTSPSAPAGLIEQLGRLTGQLLAHDRWTRQQLEAHQAERLRALLAHAVANSPYYRETLGPDAVDRPLEALPTLSKATLMAHFDQVVADPQLRRNALEAHMEGPDPAQSFLGRYRVLTTSGTTGLRGIFALTENEAALWIAAGMRPGTYIGMTPQMRIVGIGAPGSVHVTRQLYAPLERTQPGQPKLTVLTPLPEIVDALNAYQPEALVGYPTVWAMLADEQLAGRLQIAPHMGLFGAEPLTPAIRDRIRGAWGFEPQSSYSATEAPTIAVGSLDAGLEIAEDLLIVEVVDEHNRPVPAGKAGCKVLITNLVNYAQPLIRYELSDAVTLAAGPNPAGRPYRRIAAVDGRSIDVLYLRGRAGGDVALHPSGFGGAFAALPAISQYQLVYDERGLHVRVVLAADAAPDTTDRLRRSLAQVIITVGAVVPPLDVQQVAALEREPGIGAKFKLVKSSVARQESAQVG